MNYSSEDIAKQLNLPALKVVNVYEKKEILVIESEPANKRRICPDCRGRRIKQQNSFTREFWDAAPIDDGLIVKIEYTFHRYKCRNPRCGSVFSDPITFARPNCHVTKRFECFVFNYIILNSATLSQISKFTDYELSKQTIKNIFNRYLKDSVEKNPDFLYEYGAKYRLNYRFNKIWSRIYYKYQAKRDLVLRPEKYKRMYGW